jgi:Zn finger protein HypA/HybF involved in hydrogenase expression
MRTLANLPSAAAAALLERLQRESIAAEMLTCAEESGLEANEIVVEDAEYERACDVAEAWDAERIAEAEKHATRRCPKCRSPRLDCVPHEKLDFVYQCVECGSQFAP